MRGTREMQERFFPPTEKSDQWRFSQENRHGSLTGDEEGGDAHEYI